jgi:hypothetical protein
MRTIELLCIAGLLSACGQQQNSYNSTNSSVEASPSSELVGGGRPTSTAAQWNACRNEVTSRGDPATRGIINSGRPGGFSDREIEMILADYHTRLTIGPAEDGTCSKMVAVVNTIVNGNQVSFIRQCRVTEFEDTPNGREAEWVEDCRPMNAEELPED